MTNNILKISTFDVIQGLGMEKNIWYDYNESHAVVFLEKIQEILDRHPKAKIVHVIGLFPPEISLRLGYMFCRSGLKMQFSRPTSPTIELPVPERCLELDFA